MTSRIRALDGIRGLALIAVLGYHALPRTVRGGFLGVDVFFVLSGFLLTSLLLDERNRTGGIDHLRYAARRIRRLAPGGFVLLLALAVLGPLIASDSGARLRGDVLWSAIGLTNWDLIADGASYFSNTGRPPLVRHFWSLAIEVQFYLVCPLIVGWLARRRRKVAIGALLAGIAVSSFAMWTLYRAPDPYRAYYGTDARIGALLAGVLLAVVMQEPSAQRLFAWLAGPAAVVMGVLLFIADDRSRLLYPEGFLLTQAATMVLIAAGMGAGTAAVVLRARPLRWLGERSYGIYLWHWPIVALLRPGIDVSWPPVVTAAVTIAAAVVIGALSFRFVESRFLHKRPATSPVTRRRRTVVAWAGAAAALAVLAGLTVRMPTTDPIAESLSAGERVLAAQAPPAESAAPEATAAPAMRTVRANSAVPVAAPAARRVATRPLITRVRPVSVQTSAMGDSVMLGAAGPLRERLGPSSYIDAKKNRQFRHGATVAREMKVKGRMGPVVIAHLGNNGPAKQSDLDRLLGELRHARAVLLVTIRVDKPWQDQTNAMLARAARRDAAKIKLVDWYGYSNGHRDWFWKDGTHLRSEGASQYAKLIASSIPPKPKPKPAPKPAPEPTPTPGLLPPIKP